MRVVRPSSGEADTNIKFVGSPQTESIRILQNNFKAMTTRVNTLEKNLNDANQQIQTLNTALKTLTQEIEQAQNTSTNNAATLQNMMNCNAVGKLYDGRKCTAPQSNRR